jgi:hypothetical protein
MAFACGVDKRRHIYQHRAFLKAAEKIAHRGERLAPGIAQHGLGARAC